MSLERVRSRFIDVDGIRTHYLDAGEGPALVLLHSGEFGAAAEIAWEFNIGPLSEHFRVIAPDWLGFGHTDKLFDFGAGGGFTQRNQHLRRFLEIMSIDTADFVGNSIGAVALLRATATDVPSLPVRRQVVISGGGPVPPTDARQAVLAYDCTMEGMRRLVRGIFADERWADDDAYVEKRLNMSLVPGAWQCSAATQLRAPGIEPGIGAGPLVSADIDYEKIRVPTLVVAGRRDRIRPLEYMEEVHRRIRGSHMLVCDAGHCSNVEQADEVNRAIIGFLSAA